MHPIFLRVLDHNFREAEAQKSQNHKPIILCPRGEEEKKRKRAEEKIIIVYDEVREREVISLIKSTGGEKVERSSWSAVKLIQINNEDWQGRLSLAKPRKVGDDGGCYWQSGHSSR